MVLNAFPDTSRTEIGTVVKYMCRRDFRFGTGINTALIECTNQRRWFPDVGDCQGKGRHIGILNIVEYASTVTEMKIKKNRLIQAGALEQHFRCLIMSLSLPLSMSLPLPLPMSLSLSLLL